MKYNEVLRSSRIFEGGDENLKGMQQEREKRSREELDEEVGEERGRGYCEVTSSDHDIKQIH
jgi:hypothetical protein